MARSSNSRTIGNIMQKVGRALSGSSGSRSSGGSRSTSQRSRPRKGRSGSSGKGLLRKLLG